MVKTSLRSEESGALVIRMATNALCVWIGYILTLAASAVLVLGTTSSQADEQWKTCVYNGRESSYRPGAEKCCQGNILQRAENLEEVCCNGQLYDSTTGKCCGDRAWIEDDTDSFCCDDEVYPLSEDEQCCDNQWIDTTAHTCCSGRVVEGVGECCGYNDVYNVLTEHCCREPFSVGHVAAVGREAVISGFLECCSMETIDTRNKLCCQGTPIDRSSSFDECCGPDTYDTRTQVCCERRNEHSVSPLVDGKMECCGLKPYNQDTDQCCQLVITSNIGHGKCCGAEAYNPQQSSCCYPSPMSLTSPEVSLTIPEVPEVQGCCGGTSYLKTQQFCCGDALHEPELGKECCGNDLYDLTNQLCCNGHIVGKDSPVTQCCGNSNTFDPERQTCCYGQVTNFANGSCCHINESRYQAYQPQEDKCCYDSYNSRGSVQSIDAGRCCGESVLADDQLCDFCPHSPDTPIIKQSMTDNAVCCSPKRRRNRQRPTYDKEKQICLSGTVYLRKQLSPGKASCGGSIYNTAEELCCSGTIRQKMYQTDRLYQRKCCGTEAYVPVWDTCRSNGQVTNFPERFASYCRHSLYDNRTHFCEDSSGLIRPNEELGLKACQNLRAKGGYKAYDPAQQECCGDTLIGPGYTCCHGQQFLTPGTGVGKGQCCGFDQGFNPSTHTCCDGMLQPITVQGPECCGRQLFDPSSPAQMCCNDTLLSTADGKTACTDGVAHRPTDTVCQGRVYAAENGECCGPVLLNARTQICCQDKFLYERATHGNTCCGRVAYDALDVTKKCCIDSLFYDVQDLVCCHSGIMNPHTETCRAVGDVQYSFPKSESSEEGIVPEGHTVCNGLVYPFTGNCCGNQIIRSSEANVICCGDRKQSHKLGQRAVCCGGVVLDKGRYTCCEEKPLHKNHWMTCCKGVAMGRQRCKASRPRKPLESKEPSTSCGGRAYNASVMGCCNDQLYDPKLHNCSLNNVLQPLCGGAAYDNTTFICCAGTTHAASTTGCCNREPYDLGKQTCCAEKLYRVKNGSCCGDKPFNRNRYLCCDANLQKKKRGRSECCGSSAYNPAADTCCGQYLTRGTSRGSCCGDKAFDPLKKVCCPETEMLFRRRDDADEDISEHCCAPGFEYNKDEGACQPQECPLCKNLKSTKGWQRHTGKPTLIRGTASNWTSSPSSSQHHHYLVLHLMRVSHLNHNKRQSLLDNQELAVIIPAGHCSQRCQGEIHLGKAYVVMSDAEVVVEEGEGGPASLALRTTDFLARARNKLGTKIKHRQCRLG